MNFLLAAAAVFELQLPITCGPTDNILQGLRERYNEEIVFMSPSKNAKGHDLSHSLWVNPETQTWSFIVVNRDEKTTCVISSGDQFGTFQPDGTQT
jgi:hypothetical protein